MPFLRAALIKKRKEESAQPSPPEIILPPIVVVPDVAEPEPIPESGPQPEVMPLAEQEPLPESEDTHEQNSKISDYYARSRENDTPEVVVPDVPEPVPEVESIPEPEPLPEVVQVAEQVQEPENEPALQPETEAESEPLPEVEPLQQQELQPESQPEQQIELEQAPEQVQEPEPEADSEPVPEIESTYEPEIIPEPEAESEPLQESEPELVEPETLPDTTTLPDSILEAIGESPQEQQQQETDSTPTPPQQPEDFKLKYDFTSGERYVDTVSTKTEFDKVLDELAAISKDLLSWQVEKFAMQHTGKFHGDFDKAESDAKKYEAFLGGYITNAAMTLYDNGYRDAAIKQLDQAKSILEARRKLEEETEATRTRVAENDDVVDLTDILGLFGD